MRRKREREKVKVTIEQLCEFFDGIKDERINREAVQGLRDDSNRSGLKQLLKNMLAKARKAASEITELPRFFISVRYCISQKNWISASARLAEALGEAGRNDKRSN